MTQQKLMLDMHTQGIDEFCGKTVEINGTPYELVELLGSGGEAFVYRLLNLRTSVSEFVLKLHRFLPGSAEFEDLKQTRAQSMFVLEAVTSASEDGFRVAHIEMYEQNGGLLGLQRLIRGYILSDALSERKAQLTAAFDEHERDFAEADTLADKEQYLAALTIYDRILAANTDDTLAIKRKSRCMWNLGKMGEALSMLIRAIELEPNDTTTYHQVANYYLKLGWPEMALKILERTLSRYPIDFPSWRRLAEVAIEFDLSAEVINHIEHGFRIIGKEGEIGASLSEELRRSQERRAAYDRMLAAALKAQSEGRWRDALTQCEHASAISKHRVIAMLNACICCFHLADMRRVLRDAPPLLHQLRGPGMLPAIIIICIAAAECEEWQTTKRMILVLSSLVDNPFDLPTVPVVASDDGVREQGDVTPIVNIIKRLPSRTEISAAERVQVKGLLELYAKLKEAYDGAVGELKEVEAP